MIPSLLDMEKVIRIAKLAGEAILAIYHKDFKVDYKLDHSPLTEADFASHHIITNELKRVYPHLPILSEESDKTFSLNDINDTFWCVDPLDGTKEFIKKNDEFTVNIALIQNQQPTLGVIAVPAKNIVYAAVSREGAYKAEAKGALKRIYVKPQVASELTFAVSRSHKDEATEAFVARLKAKTLPAGSALKLALVAEGLVDAYPRFGPTMLWDIAAGHCIINEANGHIKTVQGGILGYNIDQPKNVPFIAMNKDLPMRQDMPLTTQDGAK